MFVDANGSRAKLAIAQSDQRDDRRETASLRSAKLAVALSPGASALSTARFSHPLRDAPKGETQPAIASSSGVTFLLLATLSMRPGERGERRSSALPNVRTTPPRARAPRRRSFPVAIARERR